MTYADPRQTRTLIDTVKASTRERMDRTENAQWFDCEAAALTDNGITKTTEYLAGRIGRHGGKVHQFVCTVWTNRDGLQHIVGAMSTCGSQRASAGGYSGLAVTPGETITCKKC